MPFCRSEKPICMSSTPNPSNSRGNWKPPLPPGAPGACSPARISALRRASPRTRARARPREGGKAGREGRGVLPGQPSPSRRLLFLAGRSGARRRRGRPGLGPRGGRRQPSRSRGAAEPGKAPPGFGAARLRLLRPLSRSFAGHAPSPSCRSPPRSPAGLGAVPERAPVGVPERGPGGSGTGTGGSGTGSGGSGTGAASRDALAGEGDRRRRSVPSWEFRPSQRRWGIPV